MFQAHAWSGVIMSCGLILGKAKSAPAAPVRPLSAHNGCRVNTVPAVAPAAAWRNLRRDEMAAGFRVLLIVHSCDQSPADLERARSCPAHPSNSITAKGGGQ